MKLLVAVKRVVDHRIRVEPTADGSGVETEGLKTAMNPFDENALEEALRLKEAGVASEIVAVSIGTDAVHDVLRHALAMGADRVIHARHDAALEQRGVARVLREVALREAAQIVLLGKQAIDDDAGQTGQMLAAVLGWPQASFVSELTVADGRARVVREVEGGTEVRSLQLPAVLTADLRLNTPRFVRLPNLMQARKKPIETLDVAALGLDLAPRQRTLRVVEPPARKAGVRVKSIAELVDRLKNEAGVL
ncbi:MAG: electron transfer flavoprotein subunit beta/FixA family protein [Candidatus Dactylopiibacterium sp.]|nr:electron transfer flavoprotein subunit beta/FixA family protein [Candidatus Dactylopiibacterium sp.]